MNTFVRGIVFFLFCLTGSTVFAECEKRIYVPQDAIKIESNTIILGRKGSFKVKSIHYNRKGLYIYKKDLEVIRKKSADYHSYRCSKCGQTFDYYDDCDLHIWDRHNGFGHVIQIR